MAACPISAAKHLGERPKLDQPEGASDESERVAPNQGGIDFHVIGMAPGHV